MKSDDRMRPLTQFAAQKDGHCITPTDAQTRTHAVSLPFLAQFLCACQFSDGDFGDLIYDEIFHVVSGRGISEGLLILSDLSIRMLIWEGDLSLIFPESMVVVF